MNATRLERIAIQNARDSIVRMTSMLHQSLQDPVIEQTLSDTIHLLEEFASKGYGRTQESESSAEIQESSRDSLKHESKEQTPQTRRGESGRFTAHPVSHPRGRGADSRESPVSPAAKKRIARGCFAADIDAIYHYTKSLIDAKVDALITIDLQGMITEVNYQMEQMTGRFRGELIGSAFADCFTDPALAGNIVRQALQDGSVANCELTARSGEGIETIVSCNATTTHDQQGHVQGIFAVASDVTERKRAEIHCHGLLESAADAIMIVDTSGRIHLANSQLAKMFHYSRESLLNQPVEMLVPKWSAANHLAHQAERAHPTAKQSTNKPQELFGQRQDGSQFPLEITLNPLVTQEQILVLRDITDRKQDEQAIRETNSELKQANQSKDSFLAGMSHELRTPLNVVIGFTGTLLMELPGPLNDEQQNQLQIIERNANQLLSLINDLLDLARIESGNVILQPESVSCVSVINEILAALQPMASQKHLELTFDHAGADVVLQTDHRMLTQILLNLVTNALKYTDRGSVVIALSQHQEAGLITEISVTDTGIGIHPKDQHRLFQAFQQLRGKSRIGPPGVGLGLHVSQKLAQLLGGHIDFHSQPGTGSTFILVIPEN